MTVSVFLTKQLRGLIEDRRIVVWYDGEQAFKDFVQTFQAPSCAVISAADSVLRARREAESVYRQMNEPAQSGAKRNLLIYVPRSRGSTPEARQSDPFEAFAIAGTAFGDKDADLLESIARQAMPERADEIRRLFAESNPTLSLLDNLQSVRRYPLLLNAVGTESASEVIALILCNAESASRVEEVSGALNELYRLLDAEIGFSPRSERDSWVQIRDQLGTYVLFSEFALDCPDGLPDSLGVVPKADAVHKDIIFSACERMRNDADLRESYIQLAGRVQAELRLPELVAGDSDFWSRDTFPFEEEQYLRLLQKHAERGELTRARALLGGRRHSVWRNHPDRAILWRAAERCLDFLESADNVQTSWSGEARSVRQMIEVYARQDGWSELDRRQRLFEQAAVSTTGDSQIGPLVERCRRRYLEVVLPIQERFLNLIQEEGWPPEGVRRQTQVFDSYVSPLLERRAKVAFFLADSLRFEMGRDLAEALERSGEVETVEAAASVLPTVTPCGMAALLPGADGAFRVAKSGDEFIPALGDRLLKGSEERMNFLRERYGDRFLDVTLDELLSRPVEKFRNKLAPISLLVVKTQDPDKIGESFGSWRARKYLSDVVGEIADVIKRLSTVGFTEFVISADHGHILLPEILPGDVVPKPQGEWLKEKRRSLLGKSFSTGQGVLILRAKDVGITGDSEEICVPKGFKVFSKGEAYFHEGLSLQEAVVPVVVARFKSVGAGQGRQSVTLHYRSDKFTSRVIGLKVTYSGLDFGEPLRVRIEAYEGSSAKAKKVGEAADCDARDERTHEITLRPGVETPVPVMIEPDFSGQVIEIRAVDPQTGVIWERLALKNAMLE